MKPEFTWSDAWLLLAVACAEREHKAHGTAGATLTDVIAWGDVINHAIFSSDELRRGFSNLIAAGWVAFDGKFFSLAGMAVAEWERIERSTRTLWHCLEKIEVFLSSASHLAEYANVQAPDRIYPTLSNREIRAACKAWHRKARRLIRENARKRKRT